MPSNDNTHYNGDNGLKLLLFYTICHTKNDVAQLLAKEEGGTVKIGFRYRAPTAQ